MSRRNLMDNLVVGTASEECQVYTLSGSRQYGTFDHLTQPEWAKIIGMLTTLQQWSSEIVSNSYSCGSFFMVMKDENGGLTYQGMCIGPFQT